MSLRSLHQLFHDEGLTVAGWIRQRRLEHCRQDLADPAQALRPVAAIAARWGFSSAGDFSRAFRAVHGLPPAEYRMVCAHCEGPCALAQRQPAPSRRCWPYDEPTYGEERGRLAMTTTQTERPRAAYALGHTPEEYERLRLQARMWETATARLLEQLGVRLWAPAAWMPAAGPARRCGLMAERVGPAGRVLGIDADRTLGAMTQAMLHSTGYRQCAVLAHDLSADEPVPGAPFDLVFARLLLFHLPERVDVLARLWDAVAPGRVLAHTGLRRAQRQHAARSSTGRGELLRVWEGAFGAVGADMRTGARLPQLFAQRALGTPDGTDVAGRLEPLTTSRPVMAGAFCSVLPTAIAHGVTTEDDAAATLASIDRDTARSPDRPMHWPLMIGAWKRKAVVTGREPTAEVPEHGQDPAVVVLGRRQVELDEDVADMLLHRARGDHQSRRDAGVGPALGHQPQHLPLARGEAVQRVVAPADQQLRHHLRVERGAAGRHPAQRVEELGARRRPGP